jgi:PAS domain S-box-containing protein
MSFATFIYLQILDRIRKVCIEGSLQFQIGELITLLDGRGPNETEASRSLASSNSACNSMRKGTRGMNPDRLKELGDRKVVESPFEDSEKRSVALLDSITDGFVGVSFDWRYTYANDSAARFLRRSKEQLIGEDVFRAFPEAKGTDFERGFRQALEDRVTTFFEAFYAPLESWFECRCYPSSEGMSVLFTDTTEKRRQERERRIYFEMVQSANSAIIRWKRDGTISFFNEYAQQVFGYSSEGIIGKHVGILVPATESSGTDLTGLVQDIVTYPERYINNINENVCGDGRRIWMTWTNKAICDDTGQVAEILAVGSDVTNLKLVEEALRKSEERYRTLFDTMTEGFALHEIITDPQGRPCDYRFLDVNPAFERITGVKRRDLVGKRVLEVLPQTESHWIENYGHVALTGEPLHMENYSADLGRWYEVFAYRSAAGRFAVIFSDITERKEAEAEVRSQQVRLSMALEAADMVTWEWDIPTHSISYSDNIETMVRGAAVEPYCSLDELTLKIHPEDRERLTQTLDRTSKEGTPFECEYRVHMLDGTYRWILGKGKRVIVENNKPVRVFGLSMDITERKQGEEELRRSHDELEQRVRKRTYELELRNKELQEFTFVASHDLQEPLRKIRSFGDMLAVRCGVSLDKTSKDYIRRMQTAAARMQVLLNSLLAYSRVTTKAEPRKKTDLKKSVEEALSNLEIIIREKSARVEVGDLPTLAADRVQMIQLFQNLIGNALKYRRDGEEPRVRIYSREPGDGEGVHEIVVEDNGIGFEEKYLDRIFLPFQRLHGRSSEYEGVGMGLAICKKIVEGHGGEITARSKVGKGSTFIVTLPGKRKKR